MDYQQAAEIIGGRDSKKLRYKTWLRRRDEDVIALVHHETDIITYHPDGRTVVDCGGWRSSTTKERLNNHLPHGWRVFTDGGIWYIEHMENVYHWMSEKALVYQDGVTIHPDGHIEGALPREEAKRIAKLRRRSNKYARDYIEALFAGKVPRPDGGDCWYCLMRFESGGARCELGKSDHILSHIEEKYYVPSLLARAIERFPVSQVAMWYLYGVLWGDEERNSRSWTGVAHDQLLSSLRRYVHTQLGMAP
jgi:hypothetical protein